MKLKYEMEILTIGDDITAVPVGTDADEYHGVLRLNGSAREIVELLRQDTDLAAITAALAEKYTENTTEEIASMAARCVDKLRAEGLITE